MSWIAGALTTCLLVPQGGEARTKPAGQPQGNQAQDKQAGAQSEYRFKPMEIPKAIVEHRNGRRLSVDGALDDWPKVVPISLRDPRQVSGTSLGAWRGPNDVSGQVYMLWDESYLFVAVQVLDEWHRPIRKDTPLTEEIPPVDNVLFTFDPNRDTGGAGNHPGRRDDTSFLCAELEQLGIGMIQWDRLKGFKALAKGAQCVTSRREKEGVTIYEARIPWNLILPVKVQPEPGKVIDMQIVVSDYDEVLDHLPQTRVGWNFGMGPQILPGVWGSMMLVREFDAERDEMPRFPAPPNPPHRVTSRGEWVKLHNAIQETRPVFATSATVDPAVVGGPERYRLLSELERHLEGYPRIDNLELHYLIQRRMKREIAGLVREGVPFYWQYATDDLLRRAVRAPPDEGLRLFRLPQGGWYVRSASVNFVIDACGLDIEKLYLQRGIDCAILTRPTEVTRRHEPLLIRMSASKIKRPFFTHMEFHLPGAKPGSMFRVQPFTKYMMGGLDGVTPLGRVTEGGKVTISYGYLVKWKDGPSLVVAGMSLDAPELEKLKALCPKVDVLILSGLHPKAVETARAIGARHTIIDDVFVASEYPAQFGARYQYGNALRLQSQLKPLRSLILAPGESIDLK